MQNPIIAVTLGDPCGIGPEVVLKSLEDKSIYRRIRPLIIGDAQILSLGNYRTRLKIRPILNPARAQFKPGTVDVLHLPSHDFSKLVPGKPNAASGENSFASVAKSVELALVGLAQAVVHAPISKLAWKMAGHNFPGHTEFIAQMSGAKKSAMAIVSEPLRTVLVTRHIPLSEVSKNLKAREILDAIELGREWLSKSKGIRKPRIAVCALNPHAGEMGLIGKEEIETIGPAVRKAQAKWGNSISGPVPADSAFRDHKEGFYDALITLYHDQSLIPLKLHNSVGLINITLGLPFARTSPGHGTAFDIAGKNKANPKPMIAAILAAAELCVPS